MDGLSPHQIQIIVLAVYLILGEHDLVQRAELPDEAWLELPPEISIIEIYKKVKKK
ncbi:hypothetical protein [Bacillus sp. ISL-46]|uniref:hypothetical protein n=1 Tax=Bacillus sp. ISL-46 TaxID=2819129 RepID=UPI001BEA803F|nr:hypothetical protein [Bacillus sp. ISL-46]MBT2721433.1 hypothetical protein [Bacillus sp. ISL-46]